MEIWYETIQEKRCFFKLKSINRNNKGVVKFWIEKWIPIQKIMNGNVKKNHKTEKTEKKVSSVHQGRWTQD